MGDTSLGFLTDYRISKEVIDLIFSGNTENFSHLPEKTDMLVFFENLNKKKFIDILGIYLIIYSEILKSNYEPDLFRYTLLRILTGDDFYHHFNSLNQNQLNILLIILPKFLVDGAFEIGSDSKKVKEILIKIKKATNSN